MKLKDINELSNKMLSNFVNEIGLDGDYFISNKTCPIIFSNVLGCGEYIYPNSKNRLDNIINSLGDKIDDRSKNIIKNRGIIIINKKYKDRFEDDEEDFFITINHEKIHSYRNLMVHDAYIEKKHSSYLSNDENFEQNNSNYETFYADASQDILKGSIDNSKNTIKKYENKSLDELDDIEFRDEKLGKKMMEQEIIDESLVELMAKLAYNLYIRKQNNIKSSIWDELENIRISDETDKDVKYMCELILKHHDFELFYWMIDPLNYSLDDIHYDFFSKYAKNDSDIVNKIYNSANVGIRDEDYDEYIKKTR